MSNSCEVQQAPICFGAVSFYSEDSDRCLACASFCGCGDLVQVNIKEMSRVLEMGSIFEAHKRLKEKKKQKALKLDDGKLKTQAPPVQKNVIQGTITLKPGPSVEIITEQRNIVVGLVGGGTLGELRETLQKGENPFPRASTEQWVLCELLRRGIATRASVETAVRATGGSSNRIAAAFSALTAVKLVTA